jgi:hypothetical protein
MRMLRESDRALAARQLDKVPAAGAQVGRVPKLVVPGRYRERGRQAGQACTTQHTQPVLTPAAGGRNGI